MDNMHKFYRSDAEKQFVESTQNGHELIQKELNVNHEEQLLLGQRISMMQGFLNDIPSSDPQYSMLLMAIQMDQIELNELKARFLMLKERDLRN